MISEVNPAKYDVNKHIKSEFSCGITILMHEEWSNVIPYKGK